MRDAPVDFTMVSRVFALVAACLALASPAALASERPSLLSNFRITSWSGGDGIMLGSIRSLVQDRDGYIWLASDTGLVRFDGSRFATSDLVDGPTPLPATPTRAVYRSRDDSLWVGYGDGHGVYQLANGRVQAVHLHNAFTGFVNAIVEDQQGAIWVATDQGIRRRTDGNWEVVAFPFADNDSRVFSLYQDGHGTMWVGTAHGLFRGAGTGPFVKVAHSDGVVRAIAEDSDGHIWTTDPVTGLRRVGAPPNPLLAGDGMSLLYDGHGNLWLATIGQGLWRVRPAEDDRNAPTIHRATAQSGMLSDLVGGLFEDRDGSIWAGTAIGLSRLSPNRILSITDLGLVHTLVVDSRGTGFVGSSGGLIELDGVTPRTSGSFRILSRDRVHVMSASEDGKIWVATNSGLHRVVNGRQLPVRADAQRLRHIVSLAADRHGVLWIYDAHDGLFRLTDTSLEAIPLPAGRTPVLLHVDGGDRLWTAYADGSIGTIDGAGRVGESTRLPHTKIYALQHDRRGALWIGGDKGLSVILKDKVTTLTSRNGLPDLAVTSIVEDNDGDFWIAYPFLGVIRLDVQDLEHAIADPSYSLHPRLYDAFDGTGMGGEGVMGRRVAAKDRTGVLWFVTTVGVAVLDPRALSADWARAQPRIEGVSFDDQHRIVAPNMTLPARTNRLRVDFTVLNVTTPERARFRYRLDGFDRDWVDGAGRRQAFYTNLPPGQYRFRLQASNGLGQWTDEDAESETDWRFAIAPAFYQTAAFYPLCVVALALVGAGAFQMRIRRIRGELSAVYTERLRLSREIHDTLLQSLVGLALQLDGLSHDLRRAGSVTSQRAVRMRRQIEDYIRDARQTIWDLRSSKVEEHGLIEALRDTGKHLTAGKMRFVFNVIGSPRPCPPKIETHVLRIGHEAVMNAVRHAEAHEVVMELRFGPRQVRLCVVDDGRGFDMAMPRATSTHHCGLLSMRERAAEAGGRCVIESQPGSGAQIIAEFPLPFSA